jgi:hypothetical protein
VFALALATLAWAPSPRMPAPATNAYVRGTREATDATCRGCHVAIAKGHDASLHAVSFGDPSFQRGYALERERRGFCRSCHAPEARPDATPDAFAGGVACVTCHVPTTGAAILAGEGSASTAPHAVTRVPDFGTRACVKCHEFSFEGSESLGEEGLMQKTVSEHARSSARQRSCVSCHGGHRYAASRDRALLRGALDVTATRSGSDLVFVLRAKNVGHAFPTGDLFRRLVFRGRGPFGVVEQAFERTFGGRRNDEGVVQRYERSDSRLVARESERRIELSTNDTVRWEVVYQRVTFMDVLAPRSTVVEEEIQLAEGTL